MASLSRPDSLEFSITETIHAKNLLVKIVLDITLFGVYYSPMHRAEHASLIFDSIQTYRAAKSEDTRHDYLGCVLAAQDDLGLSLPEAVALVVVDSDLRLPWEAEYESPDSDAVLADDCEWSQFIEMHLDEQREFLESQ